MVDTASVFALLSASAVVGALTTSQVVTMYVETAQLHADVKSRTRAASLDDELTRDLRDRQTKLTSKALALSWVAGIQWTVVAVLLALALVIANPWQGHGLDKALLPFFVAAGALFLALVLVPIVIAGKALNSLRRALSGIKTPKS